MAGYTHRQIELAEPAWHYPTKGGHTLSCGCHEPYPYDSSVGVCFWTYDSSGSWYGLTVCYAQYCAKCALKLKVSGWYIPDHKREWAENNILTISSGDW